MNPFSWKRAWYVFGLVSLTFLAFDLATPNTCGVLGLFIFGPIIAIVAFSAGVVAAASSREHVTGRRTRLVALAMLVGLPLLAFILGTAIAPPMTVGNCAL